MGKNVKSIIFTIALSLILIAIGGGGTLAYLTTVSRSITNQFLPSVVKTEIDEEFNGIVKSSIKAKNTGDTPVFMRVRLVTYWIDSDNVIRADYAAPALNVSLTADWFADDDGYYYYKNQVVGPGETNEMLAAPINLQEATVELHGEQEVLRQVIEVYSEAVQSVPDRAVEDAWPAVDANTGVISLKSAGMSQ